MAQKVIQGIYSGIKTRELDLLSADTAAYMSTLHTEYGQFAARIAVSNHQKETKDSFLEVMRDLFTYVNPRNNKHSPLVAEDVFQIMEENLSLIHI